VIDFGFSGPTKYTTPFAFRLLLNGKILTHLVEGCPLESELCDVKIFLDLVLPIATRTADCSVEEEGEPPVEVIQQAKTLMSTKEGVFLFLGLVVFSTFVGALGTFVLLTGRLPMSQRKFLLSAVEDDEDGRRRLQENGFQDEPSTEDSFVNGH
jgi:hypothetical protein